MRRGEIEIFLSMDAAGRCAGHGDIWFFGMTRRRCLQTPSPARRNGRSPSRLIFSRRRALTNPACHSNRQDRRQPIRFAFKRRIRGSAIKPFLILYVSGHTNKKKAAASRRGKSVSGPSRGVKTICASRFPTGSIRATRARSRTSWRRVSQPGRGAAESPWIVPPRRKDGAA